MAEIEEGRLGTAPARQSPEMNSARLWKPTREQRVEAAGFGTKLEGLLAAQFRYTTSLAAGAVALSVHALDQFGVAERPWLVASWGWLLVVILTGVLELERLKEVRNRVLKNFREGIFDATPPFWETVRAEAHEQGFVWGFAFLSGAGATLLFPEWAYVLERSVPYLAAFSGLLLGSRIAWMRLRRTAAEKSSEAAGPMGRGDAFRTLCRDIAAFGKREFDRIQKIPDDERMELLVVLYARCLEHYLAVVETAILGLRAPARVITRSLLEASFYFRAIQKNKVTPDDLVKEHTAWRLKLMNKLESQFPADLRDGLEITEELRAEILGMVAEKLSLEEVARRAGAHEEYLVYFERLSATVHVRKSDLRTQLRRTDSGASELVLTSDEIEVMTVAMAAQVAVDLATRLADEAGRDITPEATILIERLAKFTGR